MAGKITGPGGAPPGNVPVGANDESRPAAGSVTGERPAFADKLKSAGATTPASKADAPAAARSATADLAADLKSGKITPQTAVERVIDRVVDKQLGTNAPAAVREKLRAALETAVADDPLLADKIRGLA